jgi:hypothetical protein
MWRQSSPHCQSGSQEIVKAAVHMSLKVPDTISAAAGLSAICGVASVGRHALAVADVTWHTRLTERTGVELVATRDFVGTRDGLDHGIHYNILADSLDHQLTDRMTRVIPF